MRDAPSDDARIRDVVADLRLEEKVAQLGTVRIGTLLEGGEFSAAKAAESIPHGIGRVTRAGRESGLDPGALASVVNDVQAFLQTETRPGIPAFVREESTCGYAGRRGATFPQSIGMASTWDPGLVREVMDAVAGQLRAVGCRATLSPVADLGVDPRWGRIEETYGEDPYLAARMATAAVEGLQDGESGRVAAAAKHFAGHGRSAGGRNRAAVDVGRRTLREQDLFPFRAAVEAGNVESVMAAYHALDGVPCHADESLLQTVLRDDWGFDGTVLSDGRGIELLRDDHGIVDDYQAAGVRALDAGVDVELPERRCFGERLCSAVRDGQVREDVVDAAVHRHLEQKARAGLFDDARTDVGAAASAFRSDDVRRVARRAARRSIVLLENDGVLPLSDSVESVAVVGPNADAPRNLLGNYSYAAAESADAGVDVVTPLDALRERFGSGAVTHAAGCGVTAREAHDIDDAVDAAAAADVAVAVVGGQSGIDVERDATGTAGEGLDRTSLRLPGRQESLLRAVAATGTPVVAVLVNGRPLSLAGVADDLAAVVEAWLPGQAGGTAIADVLRGAVDAGGRLPVSIPRSAGHLPSYYHQTPLSMTDTYVFDDVTPWQPFGHGESYATFDYGDFRIAAYGCQSAVALTAAVDVRNTGDRSGDDVVQLYVASRSSRVARPAQRLVGFHRVHLTPGARTTVRFEVPPAALAVPVPGGEWVVEPGDVDVRVARSATNVRHAETVTLAGDETRPPSPVAVTESSAE